MQLRSVRSSLAMVLFGMAAAMPAAAQYRNAEDAIHYRQSAMTLQGNHMGRLFAMASGRVPFDAKIAAEQVDIVAMLNRLQFAAFIEGSDKGKTNAKPEVWSEKDKFAAAISKSQDDVNKLVTAVRSGNFDQFKAATGAVGQSCKGCHDNFKRE